MYKNLITALYAERYGLQPGDRLIEPIFQTGLSKHHSIYLGMDQYGQEWIAENQKFKGVRLVLASDFIKEHKKYTIQRFPGTYDVRIAAVKRALAQVGKPYDLILYNCEHYASFVQNGKANSKQVEGASLLIGLLLVCILVTS